MFVLFYFSYNFIFLLRILIKKMIKFLWYIFSLLTIFFILINSPSNTNNNFVSQNKIMNFSSNQFVIQKFIIFNSFIFFTLTIIRLIN